MLKVIDHDQSVSRKGPTAPLTGMNWTTSRWTFSPRLRLVCQLAAMICYQSCGKYNT